MNYFLIYFGSIPLYIQHTIEAINNLKSNAKIYLLTNDPKYKNKLINIYNLDEFKNSITYEVLHSTYYKNQNNPLWNTSMARIFGIKDLANKLDISDKIIHFDIDVLVYRDFDKYINKFENKKGLHITQTNENELIFGFSYLNDLDVYGEICNLMYDKLFGNEDIANKSIQNSNNYSFNEMRMLREIQNEHPSLIHPIDSVPKSEEDIIFDPLDMGLLLGGQDKYEEVPTIIDNYYLGKYLIKDRTSRVSFIDGKPVLRSNGKEYKIFNLHIHNKKLSKYI